MWTFTPLLFSVCDVLAHDVVWSGTKKDALRGNMSSSTPGVDGNNDAADGTSPSASGVTDVDIIDESNHHRHVGGMSNCNANINSCLSTSSTIMATGVFTSAELYRLSRGMYHVTTTNYFYHYFWSLLSLKTFISSASYVLTIRIGVAADADVHD